MISLTIVLVGLTVVLCEAVYSQETRQPRAPVFKPFDEDRVVHRIALDPTGQILASAGFHRVRVIRTAMQEALGDFEHEPAPFHIRANVAAMKFSADGDTLLSVGWDGRLLLWSVSERRIRRVIREPWIMEDSTYDATDEPVVRTDLPFVPFVSAALCKNGSVVAAGTIDGTVHVWRGDTGRYLAELGVQTSRRRVRRLEQISDAHIDREKLATRLAKTPELGTELSSPLTCEFWRVPDQGKDDVHVVGLNSDGTSVAYLHGYDLRFVDIETKRERIVIQNCNGATMSGDHTAIVCWRMKPGTATLIDVEARQRVNEFTVSVDGVSLYGVKTLPDLRHLVASCSDGRVRLIDSRGNVVVATYAFDDKPEGIIDDWAVSDDGNVLAVHWRDKGTRIWHLAGVKSSD